MATYINHVVIASARNGTATHTVNPATTGTIVSGAAFTPTAGNLLVCVALGAVTSTTPSGWTLPSNASAVNYVGLYVWHRSATGADTVTTTNNAANYPLVFHFFEFAAGSTFTKSAAAVNVSVSGGAGPSVTGLTGIQWVAAVAGRENGTTTSNAASITWSAGTEIADYAEPSGGATNGCNYGLTAAETTLASWSSAATFVAAGGNSIGAERLTFAVAAVAPSVDTKAGSATGSITWAGSAAGVKPIPGVKAGSASGAVAWVGSTAGARVSRGAATGSVTWVGTAAGPAVADSIAVENTKPGRARSLWYDGVGSEQMPAFARSSYYLPGETAEFSVDYSSAFTFDVIRMGHYGGTGGRRVAGPTAGTPVNQPPPVAITGGNGAVHCTNWTRNVTWTIPADAVPGWYYLYLTNGAGDFGHVLFCVSDKTDKKPILAVTGEATWGAAYNGYGGNNVYGASKGIGDINARAYCSSYDTPVISREYVPTTHFFNAAWSSFKYLESLGVEVGYTTIEQIHNDPSILDGREIIIFAGHNEYISQPVMDKTKALLAAGQKIVNWAANDFFWRIKYGSTTSPNTPGRVMWCKKNTMSGPAGSGHAAGTLFAGETAVDWTGTWQDTRWSLREPTTEFLGDRFIANGIRNDSVRVPETMKASPLWRDCPAVQALAAGQSYTFGAGSLGMEWDMPDGPMPQTRLSSSTVTLTNNAADVNGERYDLTVTAEHSITALVSGAGLVFNFNSDQWGKTLDDMNIRHGNIATVNARQACLNLLVDLGAVADAPSVAAASLTYPTPVADVPTAYGIPVAPNPREGVASGGVAWVSTVAGSRNPIAAAAGAISWAGSVSAKRTPKAAATATVSWEATVTGTRTPKGSAGSGVVWAGAVSGSRIPNGTFTSSAVWAGSAMGIAPTLADRQGAATGAVAWAGSMSGRRDPTGSVSAAVAWVGAATGYSPSVANREGSATGTVAWDGGVTGTRTSNGAVAGWLAWAGAATGVTPAISERAGTADGAVTWAGGVVAARGSAGAATGTVAWVGIVFGTNGELPTPEWRTYTVPAETRILAVSQPTY